MNRRAVPWLGGLAAAGALACAWFAWAVPAAGLTAAAAGSWIWAAYRCRHPRKPPPRAPHPGPGRDDGAGILSDEEWAALAAIEHACGRKQASDGGQP